MISKYGDRDLEGNSTNWKNWESSLSSTTCKECADKHGTIFPIDADESFYIPRHLRCMCALVPMRTKLAGTCTSLGFTGADFYLAYFGYLPSFYINKLNAKKMVGFPKKEILQRFYPKKCWAVIHTIIAIKSYLSHPTERVLKQILIMCQAIEITLAFYIRTTV